MTKASRRHLTAVVLLVAASSKTHVAAMALPGGWKPSLGLPSGVSIANNFLGSAADKKEAEEALKVSISDDASLWESNAWEPYVGGSYTLSTFDRCVFIGTYGLLKAGKLSCDYSWERGDYYEEELELPLLGSQCFNRWVVHGYVSATQRVCRSTEGIDYGVWSLVTFEADKSKPPTELCQTVLPSNGAMLQVTFERCE